MPRSFLNDCHAARSPVLSRLRVAIAPGGRKIREYTRLPARTELVRKSSINSIAAEGFLKVAFAEVISLPSSPQRAARVLFSRSASGETAADVGAIQLPEPDGDRLKERGETYGFIHAHRDVADPVFQRRKERMRGKIPPDRLAVIDATGYHQGTDKLLRFPPRTEVVRNSSAGKPIEDLGPVTLPACVAPTPEWGIDGKSKDVGQEVAQPIHELNSCLVVLDSDMNVKAKNEVSPRNHLQVVNDLFVARARRNSHIGPVRERVGARCRDPDSVLSRQLDQLRS